MEPNANLQRIEFTKEAMDAFLNNICTVAQGAPEYSGICPATYNAFAAQLHQNGVPVLSAENRENIKKLDTHIVGLHNERVIAVPNRPSGETSLAES